MKRMLLLAATVSLTGCVASPEFAPGQPTAELIIEKGAPQKAPFMWAYFQSVSQQVSPSCRSDKQRTLRSIPHHKRGAKTATLPAGQPVTLLADTGYTHAMAHNGGLISLAAPKGSYCEMNLTFVPRPGATYKVAQFVSGPRISQCTLQVMDMQTGQVVNGHPRREGIDCQK